MAEFDEEYVDPLNPVPCSACKKPVRVVDKKTRACETCFIFNQIPIEDLKKLLRAAWSK